MKKMKKRIVGRLTILVKKIGKIIVQNKSNKRHISGNGIAKLCDLHVTSEEIFKNEALHNVKTIFVNSDYFLSFLKKNRTSLADKIIFVGNGDTNFDHEIEDMHIPKLLFLQNLGFVPSTQKIKVLPIGLENYEHFRSGFGFLHHPPTFHKVRNKVLVPPMSPTNDIRKKTLKDLENSDRSLFQIETKFRSIFGYLKLTKEYKFILVCEGNGHDTHRLWEVLYQKSFPVLIDSVFAQNIVGLGLPVVVVDNVNEISLEMLEYRLKAFEKKDIHDFKILWLDYWKNIIQDHE
jgi:hypothetical protein